MKKTYIQPSIQEVKIQLSHMVMQSVGFNATPVNANQAQSLRNDFDYVEIDD